MRCRQDYVGKAMALHTRYPGHNNETQLVPGSPFGRVKALIEAFFARCASPGCIPRAGVPMLSYWKADNGPLAGAAAPRLAPVHAPAAGSAGAAQAPVPPPAGAAPPASSEAPEATPSGRGGFAAMPEDAEVPLLGDALAQVGSSEQQQGGVFGSTFTLTSAGRAAERPADLLDVHDRVGHSRGAGMGEEEEESLPAAGQPGQARERAGAHQAAGGDEVGAAAAGAERGGAAERQPRQLGGAVVQPKRGQPHQHHKSRWAKSHAATQGTRRRKNAA
jgi:hypothetical protein